MPYFTILPLQRAYRKNRSSKFPTQQGPLLSPGPDPRFARKVSLFCLSPYKEMILANSALFSNYPPFFRILPQFGHKVKKVLVRPFLLCSFFPFFKSSPGNKGKQGCRTVYYCFPIFPSVFQSSPQLQAGYYGHIRKKSLCSSFLL